MFAEIEAKIVERLKEVLPATTKVFSVAELERVPEYRQHSPAVYVIYDGYNTGDRIATGRVQRITQDWLVVCAAKSAAGQGDPTTASRIASEMAAQVLAALLGHHLGNGSYLNLGDAPGPEFDSGFCYLPLTFSNPATFKGDESQ